MFISADSFTNANKGRELAGYGIHRVGCQTIFWSGGSLKVTANYRQNNRPFLMLKSTASYTGSRRSHPRAILRRIFQAMNMTEEGKGHLMRANH